MIRKKKYFLIHIFAAFFLSAVFLRAESEFNDVPLFLADLNNPNDFSIFANGGWDGNWYVGYNTCWIQKIVVPSQTNYKRAFIGAKLGRMKNVSVPGKPPWEKKAIPGEIYMAISPTPSWTRKQSYFLTSSDEIPLEADNENGLEGVGESEWFWREIPISAVTFGTDNYLALWSPTESFSSVSSAPILAAGWGNKETNSWLDNDIKGVPPTKPDNAALTPITIFEPAIALKLIPEQKEEKISQIRITKVEDGKKIGKYPEPKIIWGAVQGESVERVWIEISTDSNTWNRYGRTLYKAPYCFTIKTHEVTVGPDGKTWGRIGVADLWENNAFSEPVNLFERRNQ